MILVGVSVKAALTVLTKEAKSLFFAPQAIPIVGIDSCESEEDRGKKREDGEREMRRGEGQNSEKEEE